MNGAHVSMKKRVFIAAVAAVIVLFVCVGGLLWKYIRSADEFIGTWMLYEGGSIAPDVLTFNEDGTGVAYTLSDAYQDNSMTDVQLPQNYLEHAQVFRWSADNGMLTLAYEDGETDSYEMSFYTMADVRLLDLRIGMFGGGYVPAEVVD